MEHPPASESDAGPASSLYPSIQATESGSAVRVGSNFPTRDTTLVEQSSAPQPTSAEGIQPSASSSDQRTASVQPFSLGASSSPSKQYFGAAASGISPLNVPQGFVFTSGSGAANNTMQAQRPPIPRPAGSASAAASSPPRLIPLNPLANLSSGTSGYSRAALTGSGAPSIDGEFERTSQDDGAVSTNQFGGEGTNLNRK